MSSSAKSAGQLPRRNVVAIAKRRAKNWSQVRQAEEFINAARRLRLAGLPRSRDTIVTEISRVERGVITVPDKLYLRLFCEVFQCDPAELFGQLDSPSYGGATYQVTSHKFVPVYVGCDAASALWQQAEPVSNQWVECRRVALDHPDADADLYIWPFGVALAHVVERLEYRTIAELALWRQQTYPSCQAWADKELAAMTGATVKTPYVLSAYWVDRPQWHGDALDTAVRLLSMPRVLLDRGGGDVGAAELLGAAELVERQLLREGGVDRDDLRSFGARGVSVGYASWSGVAFYPVAPRRALTADELVACELLMQSMWCYTGEIARQVEEGRDPVVPAAYGWRFLRAMQSRLTTPRPQEDGQHSAMRDAILYSSGLDQKMRAAIEALRQSGE
jgi:hypothetical protein